jgi:hypothetical protein
MMQFRVDNARGGRGGIGVGDHGVRLVDAAGPAAGPHQRLLSTGGLSPPTYTNSCSAPRPAIRETHVRSCLRTETPEGAVSFIGRPLQCCQSQTIHLLCLLERWHAGPGRSPPSEQARTGSRPDRDEVRAVRLLRWAGS